MWIMWKIGPPSLFETPEVWQQPTLHCIKGNTYNNVSVIIMFYSAILLDPSRLWTSQCWRSWSKQSKLWKIMKGKRRQEWTDSWNIDYCWGFVKGFMSLWWTFGSLPNKIPHGIECWCAKLMYQDLFLACLIMSQLLQGEKPIGWTKLHNFRLKTFKFVKLPHPEF